MVIVSEKLNPNDLKDIASHLFGDMVKAVVDVDRGLMAIDAELHADLEAFLLQNGSKQPSLWGINIYPELNGDNFIEFDSMINLRPSQGNRSRGVESPEIQQKIVGVVRQWISR